MDRVVTTAAGGPPPAATEPADHLALALDVDDLVVALRLARRLHPWFSVAKVGLELFSASGPEAVGALSDAGFRVFVDLKLHDIPTTVGRAARVLGIVGASMTTAHTAGGPAMLAAAAAGLAEGAATIGAAPPQLLGVTVLTSDPVAPPAVVAERARMAWEAGCAGVVCAATDLDVLSGSGGLLGAGGPAALVKVVPGIRPAGASTDDQARVATPGGAIDAGADLLVIGRAVTAAGDPEAAAADVAEDVRAALARRARD